MNNAKDNGKALHLMGLLSDGACDSHNTHLYALLEMAKRVGVEKVFVHCFMDGRDVPPSSGKDYVKELMDKLEEIGVGKIATVMGRYYAMDRDNRWERVEKPTLHGLRRGRAGRLPPVRYAELLRQGSYRRVCGAHGCQGRRAH